MAKMEIKLKLVVVGVCASPWRLKAVAFVVKILKVRLEVWTEDKGSLMDRVCSIH